MTTDRIDGFTIDRGVSLLGNRFRHMRRLVVRLGLHRVAVRDRNVVALAEPSGLRTFRARRPDDVIFDRYLSGAARRASVRLLWDLVRNHMNLAHGRSDRAVHLDRSTAATYFHELGPGGDELFSRLFAPTMCAPLGGPPGDVSSMALLQVIRNTLGGGFWNVVGGVDQIPEAIARRVSVITDARVSAVNYSERGVSIEVTVAGERRMLEARGVIVAVPGNAVASLCPQLPDWMLGPLGAVSYGSCSSAHVSLSTPPRCPYASYTFVGNRADGVRALSLEHVRGIGRCPDGSGLISVYFSDALVDDELRARAVQCVATVFPECARHVRFVHLVHWPTGIARFAPEVLTHMVALRSRLAAWRAPVDFCGDYLDGIASEAALRTGEDAADRLARRLN